MDDITVTAFSRTFARLRADRGRFTVWMIAATTIVCAAWCWWAMRTQVTLYEASATARVEVDSSTYPIQSPMVGRVVKAHLRVGQTVRAGDVLVELDAVPDRLQLRQEQVRAQGMPPSVERLRLQVAAEEQARAEEQRAARLNAEEAANRVREADTDAAYAESELAREARLHDQGLIPDRDLDKANADAQRARALKATRESAARRVPQDQTTRDRERDVRVERVRAEMALLESEQRTLGAGIDRLDYEIERRSVRAPVDGTIGEAAMLRPGAVVAEGERLASIVPAGTLFVAAQFPAYRALGRIRAGQAATLRLDGFPWAEFGTVSGHVARVAREIRDGHVRVELTIDPASTFRGTLEHGMPGSVDVAVERLTPLSLVLRTAGQALTDHR